MDQRHVHGESHPAGEPAIAIIGMSGRFPGADDVASFWRNVLDGVEAFTVFSDEDLDAVGVSPEVYSRPDYVRSRPVLSDIRGFDAGFFGYSPREAALADPQQRIFLECVWEALETAGYATAADRGTVGVYAGMNISSYLLSRLSAFDMGIDADALMIGNDKDALPTTVSYRLDLRGPSVAVQTFCSSSLVSVHLAAHSIRRGECDMAVAGGVSLRIPDRVGFLYQDGGQASPDGHVRAFDADARGSMFGDGSAVVVLKRLDRAVADRDTVYGVIRGSAVNNDGALKFSYQAPSVEGQRRCVADAIAAAGVDPADISYVEAHGTATEVGDPMEVAALADAFGPTPEKQYCVLGSTKPNVGHLDRASGVTGLIKVLQSLRHEVIPGTLHYSTPNPEIDFAAGPFRVSAEPVPWPREDGRPRTAGVSSLGMGGTNVHVIVSEPEPLAPRPRRARRWQVLPVSARTAGALDASCARLATALAEDTGTDLGDTAHTLQVGRKVFAHRALVVADTAAVAAEGLTGGAGKLVRNDATVGRRVGFLIAGVGEQYPGMVAELYATEPAYRAEVDACLAVLGLADAAALSDIFVPSERDAAAAGDLASLLGRAAPAAPLSDTAAHLVQPAVFVAEYALARLLMRWGVEPEIMIGYSLGEYVAACLAGVLSLEDALRLVAHRAKLIAALPPGAMLAVGADGQQVLTALGPEIADRLDIAVRTGSQTVLAGPGAAVAAAQEKLLADGVGSRRLETSHAYHSRMLEPAAAELTAWITENITLNAPERPYLSNVTGQPATAADVTDPAYWARHMCQTVEFDAGLAHVLADPALALVEIGPGPSLGALVRGHEACDRARWPLVTATLPAANDQRETGFALAETVGRLWLGGVAVDWAAVHADEPDGWRPGRVPLPTYPFEHQEYWLEGSTRASAPAESEMDIDDPMSVLNHLPRLDDTQWVHVPVWRQTTARPAAAEPGGTWLVYTDTGAADLLAAALRARVEAAGGQVVLVCPGARFERGPDALLVREGSAEDATSLLRDLVGRGLTPDRVVHLWNTETAGFTHADNLRRGLHTLVAYARAAGDLGLRSWSLDVVTTGGHRVLDTDAVLPDTSSVLGPVRLIPVEYPGVRTRLVDVEPGVAAQPAALLGELFADPADQVVGLRLGRRWTPSYEVHDAACVDTAAPAVEIRRGGVYLVTGGLGGIGMAMAERLARDHQARLVLMGRTPVPPREQWGPILAADSATAEVRRRIEGLRRLEALGAQVVTVAGDVSRPADVRAALAAAEDRFGALHGVLHAAGVPAVGLMQFKTNTDMERVLAPKVAGTLAIVEALRGTPVDFVVLFSSVTSATGGGAGQVDYCAANAFLDAVALSEPLPGTAVVSIDWCEWMYNGWTDGLENYDEESKKFFEWYRGTFGLSFDDGWLALRRVLAGGERHVVVSTQDFNPLVEMSRRSSIESHQATVRKIRDAMGRHPRPELSTAYVEPTTPEERAIAEVWGEALGLEQVGVRDNFFELGGNSLVGMEIIADVRKRLELIYLPPHIIYQSPTVAALAESAIAARTGETDTADDAPSPAQDQRQSRMAQRRNALRSGRTS
ncbi:SDR family NAD(P)-dependent oxidoreductase [Actinokineospora sp. 24-640]